MPEPQVVTAGGAPAGEGLAALAQTPEKKVPAPTLTDAEKVVLQKALLRNSLLRDYKIGDHTYALASLSSEDERKWVRARNKMFRRLRAEMAEDFKKDELVGLPTEQEVAEEAMVPDMILYGAYTIKAIDNDAKEPGDVAKHLTPLSPVLVGIIYNTARDLMEEFKTLAAKGMESEANIKK